MEAGHLKPAARPSAAFTSVLTSAMILLPRPMWAATSTPTSATATASTEAAMATEAREATAERKCIVDAAFFFFF